MIIELAVTAGIAALLAYYVKDVTDKVLARHFELRSEVGELEDKVNKMKNELESQIRAVRTPPSPKGGENTELLQKMKSLEEKLKGIEKSLKDYRKLETKVDYEIGNVKREIERTSSKVDTLEEELTKTEDELKKELKRELLEELEEEIEHLEDAIERRKKTEVDEFLEVIKASITLQPEKLSAGMAEAKRALLSMRDIAKVYVLTGQGDGEFEELKENLVELLKNLRKLAIVSIPDESVYVTFNDIIVRVKRLNLPMKVTHDGKERELNPERSFIQIHHIVYELAGGLDEVAEELKEPIPVTPVEKEFYEKLRYQFEQLRKLEEQVQKLMLKLGAEGEVEKPPESSKEKDVEEILRELDLL
ncbi:hypothetical protein [Thermococcus sp.]|uniref:hypothetical protein n=1 Tax=Thermococcus sp. TaxID=35749 RepID=UPI0026278E39|nr:hypothetical protein [Thermococcus sp.]